MVKFKQVTPSLRAGVGVDGKPKQPRTKRKYNLGKMGQEGMQFSP
jgi:hypothetical protein